jgi:hypothetical protein
MAVIMNATQLRQAVEQMHQNQSTELNFIQFDSNAWNSAKTTIHAIPVPIDQS